MDDAELGDTPGEAGQIGENDGAVLAEQLPDAPVDRLPIGAGTAAFLDQGPQATLGGGDGYAVGGYRRSSFC